MYLQIKFLTYIILYAVYITNITGNNHMLKFLVGRQNFLPF